MRNISKSSAKISSRSLETYDRDDILAPTSSGTEALASSGSLFSFGLFCVSRNALSVSPVSILNKIDVIFSSLLSSKIINVFFFYLNLTYFVRSDVEAIRKSQVALSQFFSARSKHFQRQFDRIQVGFCKQSLIEISSLTANSFV